MNRIRLWPHGVLVVLGVAIVAGIAAALWFKYERTAQASGLPNAARLERVDGQVGINRSLDSQTGAQWIEARPNTPVSVGDRIYTKDNSRTEISFTGRNGATIDPNTSLDILDLSRDRTQVALRSGSAVFDVGSITSGQSFEVATPCGAVDLNEPGTYQLGIDQDGNATATAFSGSAQVVGQQGSGAIHKGEVITVPCHDASGAANGSGATISRVNYDQAGTYLDNHFRYRYPRTYDGRYRSYYTYLDDPNYYDPYRRDTSYQYVSDYIPGVDDLSDYGDWQYVNNYGYCWHPRVDTGWAPYQAGYWEMDYPYGLTWVSNEPWGYAPYHYGRWAYASNEWLWVPESTTVYPTYSPALTAFIPLGNSSVAWVALGPGDPYATRYYDTSWQPVYLTSPAVTERFVNINVPGGVTVIPAQSFGQVVDARDVIRLDPQTITQARPVLDPLSVNQLRQAAFDTRRAERRFDMSQALAQRLNSTPVVVADPPAARPFRRDLANVMRVEPVPGRAKRQQLQLRDERAATAPQAQPQAPNMAAEQQRERQMADLARQAARGDRGARQQMQELRRQQTQQAQGAANPNQPGQGQQVQQQMRQARAAGEAKPNQPPRGQQVAQPAQQPAQGQRQMMRDQQRAQREAARQQTINNQQPRGQNQREMRRAQPPAIQRAPQPQTVRPQPAQPERQRGRRPEVQMQRQQSQPRVMSAPRPQPVAPQPRPQMERARPQAQPARPQAQPKAQPQPQMQRQAQPQPQKQQAQPKGQGAGKGQGKPPKKP